MSKSQLWGERRGCGQKAALGETKAAARKSAVGWRREEELQPNGGMGGGKEHARAGGGEKKSEKRRASESSKESWRIVNGAPLHLRRGPRNTLGR